MIPGRVRAGWGPLLGNVAVFLILAAGTQFLAPEPLAWNPSAWSLSWSEAILVLVNLLFLGLAFLVPLHSGVLNLGVYAQFLAGLSIASWIGSTPSIDPPLRALLAVLAGAGAGALVGIIMVWLKWRFAVHEVLSGLLLGGALLPLAREVPAPPLGIGPQSVLAWGVILLILGVFLSIVFAHFLRASAPGLDLRIVGSNPLAAVAAGVNVDAMQLSMLAAGGACAGLVGALGLTTPPSSILLWPVPAAFAGITMAVYGFGSIRGLFLASILFAAWLHAPGTAAALRDPGLSTLIAALLVIPVLWTLPRLFPDQGAPRAVWRTRHRETY